MMVYRSSWVCMDCSHEFCGHVNDDHELVLCKKCYEAFEKFVNEKLARDFTLYWWDKFISLNGDRKEREERARFPILEEILA